MSLVFSYTLPPISYPLSSFCAPCIWIFLRSHRSAGLLRSRPKKGWRLPDGTPIWCCH